MSATLDQLFAERRFVYFIPSDAFIEGHGFRVSIVFENESGHYPTGTWPYEGKVGQKAPWFWGDTFAAATATARAANEERGISAAAETAIVASSMSRGSRRRRRRSS
jgi:hypothetical protein